MVERKIRLTRSKATTHSDARWQRTGAAPAGLGRQNGFCPPRGAARPAGYAVRRRESPTPYAGTDAATMAGLASMRPYSSGSSLKPAGSPNSAERLCP
jgi:hypothetical protein